MTKRAVFLDRDGTINVDVGYPKRYEQITIYPYSFEALGKINAAGFLAVVVTNQSGIGRGFLTEDDLRDIHARMAEDFLARCAVFTMEPSAITAVMLSTFSRMVP